ncbi:MAG: hypothetical protein R3357_06380 [Burkholderiales bacterium]|nr:hypothetical protein [Burkholderiales bacterium]
MSDAMRRGRGLWWKVVLVALFAFATAAAFSAYLRPGMLIEFANFVLCS